jgi:glutathione S-transferase
VIEALDFIVGSIHMRGFTFVKIPGKFHDDPETKASLQVHGRAEVEKGLALLSENLGDQDYLLGRISVADAALFYVLSWAEEEGFDLSPNLAACLTRLRARPAYAAAKPTLKRLAPLSTK